MRSSGLGRTFKNEIITGYRRYGGGLRHSRGVCDRIRPPLRSPGDGVFCNLESELHAAYGSEMSGLHLLDRNEDGLRWRLALIDSAKYSIDARYYLWYGDSARRILLKRLLDAAERGVRVRMLVDDINNLFGDTSTIAQRDKVAAWVDAHPNLELRLFDPWSNRSIAARAAETAIDLSRVNQRMHNKALIIAS